jgi:hypothetical protein
VEKKLPPSMSKKKKKPKTSKKYDVGHDEANVDDDVGVEW